MSSTKRRMEKDVMDLMMSDHDVQLIDDSLQEMFVMFKGPKDTPYEGGTWKIKVDLPNEYPIKSPSIGFTNTIFHPNIDEHSGSVCLDVINQTWSPMFGLLNVFENFLPHLLRYPNAADPLNSEASKIISKGQDLFKSKVEEYVKKFAMNITNETNDAVLERNNEAEDDELSDVGSLSSEDDELSNDDNIHI